MNIGLYLPFKTTPARIIVKLKKTKFNIEENGWLYNMEYMFTMTCTYSRVICS